MEVGFLDPAAPKKLMPRLNQLFNRADLTEEDIHILRGIAKAMQKQASGTVASTGVRPVAPPIASDADQVGEGPTPQGAGTPPPPAGCLPVV